MPTLHLVAGPNGAGKSTYITRVVQPITHLPVISADEIAAARWPDAPDTHAYDASRAAATDRSRLLTARHSFITETVFSHPSKVEFVQQAVHLGYVVHLHVVLVPTDTAVGRVDERVRRGGHHVPEHKVRERHDRLWHLIASARDLADRADFLDNSRAAEPYRLVAAYERGRLVGQPQWPTWTPAVLTDVSDTQ